MKSMICKKLILLLLTGVVHLNCTYFVQADEKELSVGGKYYFKNRVYQLMPFTNMEPKTIDLKKRNSYLKELVNNELIPQNADLTLLQTPVKNQSERGSCAYFSTTALIENALLRTYGKNVNISEEYLIYYTKAVLKQSPGGDGSYSYDNLIAFQKNGFLLESDWPYNPSWFHKGLPCEKYNEKNSDTPGYCFSHFSPPASLTNSDRRVVFDKFLIDKISGGSEQIVQVIGSKKRPVLVGLPLHDEGWDGETGECIYNEHYREECLKTPDQCGSHSIVLIGYDLKKREFKFKNSWGNDWGKKGYGTLSFDYVDKYQTHTPLTIRISGELKLPEDYNKEITYPNLSKPQFLIEERESTSSTSNDSRFDKNTVVALQGELSNLKNTTFYLSTYVAAKKKGIDSNTPINTENVDLVPTKSDFEKEYGKFVKGTYYLPIQKILSHDVPLSQQKVIFGKGPNQVQAENIIPIKVIDFNKAPSNDLFLRVSAYVHDDIEGWRILKREFLSWKNEE